MVVTDLLWVHAPGHPGLHGKPSKAPETFGHNITGFPEVLYKTMEKHPNASPVIPGVAQGYDLLMSIEDGIVNLCPRMP